MNREITLIILASGESNRFDKKLKKQWISINNTPLWLYVANKFNSFYEFSETIITTRKIDTNYAKYFTNYKIVAGGKSRQESIKNALEEVKTPLVMINDVARCFVTKDLVNKLIEVFDEKLDVIVPAIKCTDTTIYDEKNIDRNNISLIQTPQLCKSESLRNALKNIKTLHSDESSLIFANNGNRKIIDGDYKNIKITTKNDLLYFKNMIEYKENMLFGNGIDVHGFTKGNYIRLCGIDIPYNKKFLAHSDGDVAIHSIVDSILGAIGAGDIGEIFPDNDEQFKDIDSMILLKKINDWLNSIGFKITNIDVSILAEAPKLLDYKRKMRMILSKTLALQPVNINIKATTTEGLGFIGKEEGITVLSTTTIKNIDWNRL